MDGTRFGEPGSAESLAAALRSSEYQEARRRWLNDVVSRAIATGASGIILFIAIQFVRALPALIRHGGPVPVSFWGHALSRPTGLSEAVAASVVTALVALVATLNVAVVVATWRTPTLDVHHVQTSMWIGAMIAVVTLSGVVAVLTAMTQFVVRPALGILLLAVAALAIIAAAATQRRPTDWLPAVFRLAAAERRVGIADHVLGSLRRQWPEVNCGSKASREVGMLVLIVALSAVSSAIVLTVVWGRVSISRGDIVVPTWRDALQAFAWTTFPVISTVIISMVRQRTLAAAAARKAVGAGTLNAAWYRGAHWVTVGIGCLLFGIWAYGWRLPGGAMPAGFWIYAFALQPVSMSVLVLVLGRRRGWRPGLWAAQWTVHSAEEELSLAKKAEDYAQKQVGAAQVAMAASDNGGHSVPAERARKRWFLRSVSAKRRDRPDH